MPVPENPTSDTPQPGTTTETDKGKTLQGVVDTSNSLVNFVNSIVKVIGNIGSLIGKIGGIPADHLPPEWTDTNLIAQPVAKAITLDLSGKLTKDQAVLVLAKYLEYVVGYVNGSKHASETTNNTYITAFQKEVMTKTDELGFSSPPYAQLVYAIWLHAMWSYGNFGKDVIASGKASSEFYAQLNVTLFLAAREVAPKVIPPAEVTLDTNASTKLTTTANAASFSGLTIFLLIGAAVFMIPSLMRKG